MIQFEYERGIERAPVNFFACIERYCKCTRCIEICHFHIGHKLYMYTSSFPFVSHRYCERTSSRKFIHIKGDDSYFKSSYGLFFLTSSLKLVRKLLYDWDFSLMEGLTYTKCAVKNILRLN